MSQWGEVKKKTKDRSQSKAKDSATTSADTLAPSTRGGRGRGGSETARGTGRGRGASDRSRGASRAGRGGRAPPSSTKVNGTASTTDEGWGASAPSGTWDDSAAADASTSPLDSGWEHVSADSTAQAPEEPKPASKPDGSRSWASMFAKPKQAPAPPKAPKSAPTNEAPIEPPTTAPPTVQDGNMQGLPPPVTISDTSEIPNTPPATELVTSEQAADLTPTKDDLTETNLEKLPDNSGPVTSATAASTAASTLDQRGFSGTPLLPAQPVTSSRPPMGGYATTAYKATGMPGRTASYQRRVLEQQEAVVMPGKHAVDKAAVQFGSMGLNGTPEDVDVDSDREDPETRVQPPQHSPVAPRASLPPAPLQQQPQGLPQPPVQEPHATPRQAPGLPPVSQPLAAQAPLNNNQLPKASHLCPPHIRRTINSVPIDMHNPRLGLKHRRLRNPMNLLANSCNSRSNNTIPSAMLGLQIRAMTLANFPMRNMVADRATRLLTTPLTINDLVIRTISMAATVSINKARVKSLQDHNSEAAVLWALQHLGSHPNIRQQLGDLAKAQKARAVVNRHRTAPCRTSNPILIPITCHSKDKAQGSKEGMGMAGTRTVPTIRPTT